MFRSTVSFSYPLTTTLLINDEDVFFSSLSKEENCPFALKKLYFQCWLSQKILPAGSELNKKFEPKLHQ